MPMQRGNLHRTGMKCKNCGNRTHHKFCSKQCKQEYHYNIRLTQIQVNVLLLLKNRRGWVSVEYNSTVYGLEQRQSPLLMVRKAYGRWCEAHILPNGERFLARHYDKLAMEMKQDDCVSTSMVR